MPDTAAALPAVSPWPADRIERRPVAELIPYARNARTHSDAQIGQLAASIREWGWTMPVLVDEQSTIIAGHGRVLAAQKLGLDDIPCMVAAGWSEAQKRAYVLADNKLAENAGWDHELLAVEVADLRAMGADLELVGFNAMELDALLGEPEDPDAAQWDGMPEYEHEDLTSKYRVIVHFADVEGLRAFAAAIGQTVTESTRAIWYPPAEIGRYADKLYAAEPEPDDES